MAAFFPLTLYLGEDGEQMAAVLPGREEASVAALVSWENSGETGPSSLSDADSLDNSIASKADERKPTRAMTVLRVKKTYKRNGCYRCGVCESAVNITIVLIY